MSEVKYEAVFGNLDFDDFDWDTAAVCSCGDFLFGITEDELKSRTLSDFRNEPIIAMRRIIRTPIWSPADQKEGKFPEVGSMLNHKTKGECTFIGFGDDDKKYWALKLKNDLIYIADKNWCTPIELPEVKAARLREEWKNNVIEIHHGKRRKMSTSTFLLDDIYDALLSGELKAPGVE